MKRIAVLVMLAVAMMFCSTGVFAADYNYVSPKEMKAMLKNGTPLVIVDIQEHPGYEKHHFPGSVATYAYPVKSDEERGRIDAAVKRYEETGNQVVVVCPRGKGGAKRCYDYMKAQNVPEEKLFILEKGADGWPFAEGMVSGKD